MKHFAISVDVTAPPERVWAVMSDVERWPEWTPSVTSITRLDKGPLAAGSRARIRQPKLAPALWKVTSIEQHSFTWETVGPGIRVIARHAVAPIPIGSRATLSLEFGGVLGPLIGWLTKGLNNRYLNLEAAGLKRRSEDMERSAPSR